MTSIAKDKWTANDEAQAAIKRVTSPSHFIERLKERYDLDMTPEEYHALLAGKTYVGLFDRGAAHSVGTVMFKGVKVWCLYNRVLHLFTTCFPPDVETNSSSMLMACFSRGSRPVATALHEVIAEELHDARMEFSSLKEASLHYYRNSKMPKLLVHQYRFGTVPIINVCKEIKHILKGHHRFVKLDLKVVGREKIPEFEPTSEAS